MARPNRVTDHELASQLREYMLERAWTGSDVARMLHVHKGTISRALSASAFSPALRPRVAALIETEMRETVPDLLQKSLHLLLLSDTLRSDAVAMISHALDLTRQT